MCLANISKDFTIDNMKTTGLNGYVYDFSVDYDACTVDDILELCKYLMKCLDSLKIVFIGDGIYWSKFKCKSIEWNSIKNVF